MTINLDISDDFTSVLDNLESVTVLLRPNSGDSVEVSVSSANRSPLDLNTQNVDGFNFTTGSKAVWGIPDSQLNPNNEGRSILADDLIIDGSVPAVKFAVISSRLVSLGGSKSYWQCICSERQ